MSSALAAIPNVDIDPQGVFKYILIQVTDESTKDKKLIVRGYGKCEYHADIFDEVQRVVGSGIRCKCPGGGRIDHDATNKKLKVYGYSQGFGKADHSKAVDLLKEKYPNYTITWSDDGY
ncbi:sex-regulated protein janus-A-like protein [Aphelenchoides avenae]|nr:sex-regulated protein janus-A-like protein [Aphelenchus avenae]